MTTLFVERSLDEVRFWSRIMKEHALFLRLGFTVDQTQLAQEADRYYRMFEEIEEKSQQLSVDTDSEQMARFNMEAYHATAHIWSFKRKVLDLILTCKIITNNYPLLVDHTSREAAYFMNRLEQLNKGTLDPVPDAIINENVFFLRVMADHAKFIGHLLDPSERDLVAQAADFSYQFDQLLFQAVDLESMRPQSQTVPMLGQFLDTNRVSVRSLRDFKKTAHELIEACRIRSIIHPLLADHTFREAERFLLIIDMFEASLVPEERGKAK
ncbi:DUF2935 domain-containing protein [Aneurinibacillus tyrosinisolvens]|uniref:DUF2935 domain-containing protein n=1 Tax=Aneurinibacillus tyrosinisolvens TaxID=1443435 RepID=UPI00063EE71C|nr:DUF2935 domain-containing protein [Aneurinibacillus tyrosinisolvens]